jgi:hypothetical protein
MDAKAILEAGRECNTFKGVNGPTQADMKIANNFLFHDERKLYGVITKAIEADLEYHNPINYSQFLQVIRNTAKRYAPRVVEL